MIVYRERLRFVGDGVTTHCAPGVIHQLGEAGADGTQSCERCGLVIEARPAAFLPGPAVIVEGLQGFSTPRSVDIPCA